jgi:hypothetical protein
MPEAKARSISGLPARPQEARDDGESGRRIRGGWHHLGGARQPLSFSLLSSPVLAELHNPSLSFESRNDCSKLRTGAKH